jgi:hypothetical protein
MRFVRKRWRLLVCGDGRKSDCKTKHKRGNAFHTQRNISISPVGASIVKHASKREGELEGVGSAKIYNGEDSKFHRYEDTWELLEK